MITQLQELISGLTGIDDSKDSLQDSTVLEQLEQENSKNVTERHLLTSEKEYEDSGRLAQYGIQLSSGIILNSAITYGILHAIKGVTLSFNPWTFGLICGGANVAVSLLTSDSKHSPRANLMLGAAKFTINMTVNGSLIGHINHHKNESKVVVESIRREINNYESGYKESTPDYGLLALIVLGFIAVMYFYDKNQKSSPKNNE